MKLPGVGEVTNKNLMIGGGVIVGIVGYAYWKKKRAAATGAAVGTAAVDPNAIDPATGVPYGQEAGSGGGYYTNASVPNPYVNQGSTVTTGTGQTYTSNTAWLSDATQTAVNFFGVASGTASSGLGKYLTQNPKGLNPDEYQAVSEVVATIGQPPNGGPFRLIQAAPVQNPSSTPTPTPEPDQHPTPTPAPPPRYVTDPSVIPTIGPPHTNIRGQIVSPQPPAPDGGGGIPLPGFYGRDTLGQYWDGRQWVYT